MIYHTRTGKSYTDWLMVTRQQAWSTQPKCDFNMDHLNQIAAKLNDIIDNHMSENMTDEEFDAWIHSVQY